MAHLRITVQLDGQSIGCYEFSVKDINLHPTKAVGGPIIIQFDPVADYSHQLVVDSVPARQSRTIRGSDPETTAT